MPSPRLPALFLGHGSPMNALDDNRYTRAWREAVAGLPRPRGVVCVSAHWYGPGIAVTAMSAPRTIHDFGGFPQALFDVRYSAPGDPQLASRIASLLAPDEVRLDEHEWGLDHGAWQVLTHLYPEADVPVVQLRIDASREPAWHLALARRLAPLRDEGILVIGSGNVVHNLRAMARGDGPAAYDWASRFNEAVRAKLGLLDHAWLADPARWGDDGRLSVPTPDHYLPMLYVLGLRGPGDALTILTDGIEFGSIGMLSFALGELASAPPAADWMTT